MSTLLKTMHLLTYLLSYVSCQSVKDITGVTLGSYSYASSSFRTCQSLGADYYNAASLSCQTCARNQTADTSATDGGGSYIRCKCAAGFYKTTNDCTNDISGQCVGFSCTSCLISGKAAYSDRSGCATCGSSTLGLVGSDCGCALNGVLVEADQFGNKTLSKTCRSCPIGTAVIKTNMIIAGMPYYGSLYLCQSCPDPNMVMSVSNVCTCKAGYTITGVLAVAAQSCVLTSLASSYLKLESQVQNVKYNDLGVTILSNTMLHYFTKAATHCSFYGGPQDLPYCQMLANLCVLQLYNDQTAACSTYLAVASGRGASFVSGVSNWVSGMPWIFFSGGRSACFSDIVDDSVSLRNYQLKYVLGTYTMNGTFLGYQPLGTLFSYCTVPAPKSGTGGGNGGNTKYQIFADATSDSYSCDLTTLYGTQQLFYEVYLQGSLFNPVPVRVVNLRTGVSSNQPNNLRPINNLCDATDVLVRRFFLVDLISGLGIGSQSDALPNVIRYASQISLEVSQIKGNGRNIYPAVLTIQYTEIAPPAVGSNGAIVGYQVQGRFTSNLSQFFAILFGFFITGVVVTAMLFILTYMNWNTRNARSLAMTVSSTSIGGLNSAVIIEMAVMLLHSWVLVFFPFTVLVTWYGFVFFKLQSSPAVLLPPMDSLYEVNSPYYPFTVMLHVLAFFQLAYVTLLVYRQIHADVFFLDWEPSKTRTGSKNGNVSVWRTILIANEYSEMQTKRKTDIKFTLFFIVLVLIGSNLQFNATQQPDVLDVATGRQNVILRFAQTTFWWLIFSLGQYLWKFLIYERYISEPPEQIFIDICTIAKVSVLILDEKYHGYYLHCRSPHQFADGTMGELVDMLHKEEAGLTIDRSLEGAPNGVQSFELFASGEWRTDFDAIYQKLIQSATFAEIVAGNSRVQKMGGGVGTAPGDGGSNPSRGRRGRVGGKGSAQPSDKVLKAWSELSVFLQEFVENNFGRPALRRVVREQSYSERVLRTPPSLASPENPCVLFPDRSFDYCRMFFLGCESDLLMLNILSYSIFDFWLDNTAAAVFLCYILDCAIAHARRTMGKAVIAKKTLVDKRFLF